MLLSGIGDAADWEFFGKGGNKHVYAGSFNHIDDPFCRGDNPGNTNPRNFANRNDHNNGNCLPNNYENTVLHTNQNNHTDGNTYSDGDNHTDGNDDERSHFLINSYRDADPF